MKDYVNFEGLSYFFNRLIEKFSSIGHTHTKADISDLQDLIVSDDDNGNVSLTLTSLETLAVCDNTKVITLEEELNTLSTNVTTEIGALKTKDEALQGNINTLTTSTNTLTGNVNTLTTDVGTLKTDVGTLKSVVNDNDILVCK